MTRTIVWVSTSFVAYHRWCDAPEHVRFLRDYHRHLFKLRLGVPVCHGDRAVEFFTLKAELDAYLTDKFAGKMFDDSCEHIAADVLRRFGARWCEVSEDGENGATVEAV